MRMQYVCIFMCFSMVAWAQRALEAFGPVVCFRRYLQGPERPKGFITEEVVGILKINPISGFRYAEEIMGQAEDAGYATKVMEISASVFGEVPRLRVFIIGCTDELGGGKAALWICNQIEDSIAYRSCLCMFFSSCQAA
jgi:hypothetical protein